MENNIQLSQEQQSALNLMQSDANVFITGPGGTGKTVVIREFMSRNRHREIVVLAPTGKAARQIGGSTLHRFFGFPSTVLTPESVKPTENIWRMLQIAEIFILDEVSMIRSDVLFMMDYMLKMANNNTLPFGGKRIILLGDYYQLSPIVADDNIQLYLDDVHNGIYAFNTRAWDEANFQPIVLQNIYRQQDVEFINILNSIRVCDSDAGHYIQQLNEQVRTESEVNIELFNNPDHICLCTTNKLARAINYYALSMLQDEGILCSADLYGTFDRDDLPADEHLQVKTGQKVMLLANVNPGTTYGYVNGDTGIVEDYCPVSKTVVVRLSDGRRVVVEPYTWLFYEYDLGTDPTTGKLHIYSRQCGSMRQLPLRAGYACSIHKSQGQTLNHVHIALGNGCFTHGQLYTALSRVRFLRGLNYRPFDKSL